MATISLLHERSMRHSDTVNEQLQTALNSRVVIEQAKGKLAERLGLDMDQAFSVLRDHARTRNLRLSDVALAFINGSETLARTGDAQEHPARRDRLPTRARRTASPPPIRTGSTPTCWPSSKASHDRHPRRWPPRPGKQKASARPAQGCVTSRQPSPGKGGSTGGERRECIHRREQRSDRGRRRGLRRAARRLPPMCPRYEGKPTSPLPPFPWPTRPGGSPGPGPPPRVDHGYATSYAGGRPLRSCSGCGERDQEK